MLFRFSFATPPIEIRPFRHLFSLPPRRRFSFFSYAPRLFSPLHYSSMRMPLPLTPPWRENAISCAMISITPRFRYADMTFRHYAALFCAAIGFDDAAADEDASGFSADAPRHYALRALIRRHEPYFHAASGFRHYCFLSSTLAGAYCRRAFAIRYAAFTLFSGFSPLSDFADDAAHARQQRCRHYARAAARRAAIRACQRHYFDISLMMIFSAMPPFSLANIAAASFSPPLITMIIFALPLFAIDAAISFIC